MHVLYVRKNGTMKKQIFLSLIVAIILVPAIVFAASYAWVTTLSIDYGSTLKGATRDYPYKYHNLWFTPTSAGSGAPTKIKISAFKSKLFHDELKSTKIVSYTVDTNATVDFGSIGTGKHYYYFYTKDGTTHWASLKADPVTFVSRDYK